MELDLRRHTGRPLLYAVLSALAFAQDREYLNTSSPTLWRPSPPSRGTKARSPSRRMKIASQIAEFIKG